MDAKYDLHTEPLPGTPGSELIRSYIWEMPVRVTHWTTFLAIVVLSATGYYIHDPYFIVPPRAPFVMGTARFIHVAAGFVLLMSFLVRIYWLFAGNRCARLSALHSHPPVAAAADVADVQILFLPPLGGRSAGVRHNPLAGITYTGILILIFVSIFTGFVLLAAGRPRPGF